MSALSLLIIAAAAPVAGLSDETIVVTAQRLVDEAAVSVEVIDDDLVSVSPTLADALTTSPSVDIVTPGAAGSTELFLRGGDANFTAITLDGVRLNDVTDSRGGAVDVGAIAPFEVERAQIAKGAVSVLEGSDALAGQIAMETGDPRDGARVSAMGRVAQGGLGSANARLVLWRGENAALSVTGTWFDLGDAPGGQTFSRQSLGAKLAGSTRTGNWVAAVRHGETSREVFPDASGGDRLAASPELETSDAEMTTASLRYGGGETGGWSPGLALTYLQRTEDRVSPAVPPAIPAGETSTDFRDRKSVV